MEAEERKASCVRTGQMRSPRDKNAREAVCMKGKRSVLDTPKKCSFQVKDADDPRIDVIFPHCAV